MDATANLKTVYVPSEDVVAREIEGELIIVPLVSRIGDMDGQLFTLNNTGRAIWNWLDGKRNLHDLVGKLSEEFEDPGRELEVDVIKLVEELLRRRLIVEVSGGGM